MATLDNDLVILLQNASPRTLPVYLENAGIVISTTATVVSGPEDGTDMKPAAIVATAKLTGGLEGSVTWTATPSTVSLTPAGNTVSVDSASMPMGATTLTATLDVGGKVFSSSVVLTRIKDFSATEAEIASLLNNTKDLTITASALNFNNSSPNITLSVNRKNGLAGTVTWTVLAGSATVPATGDSVIIQGATVPAGSSITVRARVVSNEKNYDAYVTLTKLGVLSGQDTINLGNQVVGYLANSNVSGLGSLALANYVNLNTQTVGALNGQTQVTNLGVLAYANALAADQIGAGVLAANVIYAGNISANQITAGNLQGVNVVGAARVAAGSPIGSFFQFDASSVAGPFQVFVFGANFSVQPWVGGTQTLVARGDGSEVILGPVNLNITAENLTGSMGSRILLKNVNYSATVNGSSGYTISFN